MARRQTPWHRKQTGWWMVELDGEQTKLVRGPRDELHRRLAEDKLVELRRLRRHAPEGADARVADLAEAFLRHSRLHHAPDTHRIYHYYLTVLAEECGLVAVAELRPFHLQRVVDAKADPARVLVRNQRRWRGMTAHNFRKAAARVTAWAAEQQLLAADPLKGMKNPKPPSRRRALTEAEFKALYAAAGGPLKDLLLALYLTGARPKEARDLRWDQVRADRWVLNEHKTAKTAGKPRVVYLPVAARDIMDRRRGNGHTHVFLNTQGEPWTMSALRQQIVRLRQKLKLADDVTAYLTRHGFGTRAILNGVDGPTLAELMGHASQEMISKVYVHLADQTDHLAAAVERVSGASSPTPSPSAPGPVRKRARRLGPDGQGKGPGA